MMVLDDGPVSHGKLWRGAGLACPVFSLRTHSSVGVGEFLDIKKMVDLCSAAGAVRANGVRCSPWAARSSVPWPAYMPK
jgi:4-alpha-glucanotransferase